MRGLFFIYKTKRNQSKNKICSPQKSANKFFAFNRIIVIFFYLNRFGKQILFLLWFIYLNNLFINQARKNNFILPETVNDSKRRKFY